MCVANVESNLEPADVIIGFSESPLMTIFTSPDCTNFDWANSKMKTSNRITIEKATTDVAIVKDTWNSLKFLTNIIQKKFDIYNFFKIKFTFLEALII